MTPENDVWNLIRNKKIPLNCFTSWYLLWVHENAHFVIFVEYNKILQTCNCLCELILMEGKALQGYYT